MLLVHGSIAIPRPINGSDDYDRLVGIWSDVAPELLPTFAGSHEPIRRTFDIARRGENLALWTSTTLWLARRPRPSVKFSSHGALGRANSTMHLTVAERDAAGFLDQAKRLVLSLASAFEADFAGIHALCQSEVDEARSIRRPDVLTINRRTGLAAMAFGHAIPTARDGLDSLYWGNFFGPRLQAFFGADAVDSAGWELLERVDSGALGWVTTAPPDDATWAGFRNRRDQVIAALGRTAFYPNATRGPDLSPVEVIPRDIYQR